MSFFFARSNRCLRWQDLGALQDPSFFKPCKSPRHPIVSTLFRRTPPASSSSRPGVAQLLTARECPWSSRPSLQRMQRAPKSTWHLRNMLIAWLYSRSNTPELHFTCRPCARSPPCHSSLHLLLPTPPTSFPGLPWPPSQPIPTVHRVPHSIINHKLQKLALSQDVSRELSASVF
jgi:hypothetical protein